METAFAIWPRSCATIQVGDTHFNATVLIPKIQDRSLICWEYVLRCGGRVGALKVIQMSWAKKSWAIATRKSPASVTTEAAALCMGENHRYQDWAHLFERLLDCRQQYDIHGLASLATPHQLHLAAM